MITEGSGDLETNVTKESISMQIEEALNDCNNINGPEKIVLKTILKSLQFIINNKDVYIEKNDIDERDNAKIDTNVPNSVQTFCKSAKISLDDFEEIFIFEDNNLELDTIIPGTNSEEKQIKAILSILTAYDHFFGIKEIKSADLLNQLEELEIDSLGNVSTFMQKKDYKKFIEVIGKHNGPKTYRIRKRGIKKGLKIIKELTTREGD